MKISLNEIKKLVPAAAKIETDELIRLIGSRLVEVEGFENWSEKYDNIYIVRVISAEKIPDTHLTLCQIDIGQKSIEGMARRESPSTSDSTNSVQVVCGAPNVREGMLAVWIAPGAIVPVTYHTSDEFKIDARKLRGHESNGMLSAADELALGDDHEGIVEIDPEMIGADGEKVFPGEKFADAFGLDDIILDIENKSLTHRPDTFGLIGFAREVSGILGEKFVEPDVYADQKHDSYSHQTIGNIDVQIADDSLCSRYSCAVLDFAKTPRAKYFSLDDVFLAKADMHAISPIVDATNIMMLKTGQPLHAFDYDKFIKVGGTETPRILVRAAKPGEKLELLDGKTIECDENDILITSNDVPVALAGAMGGKNTEIDESTTHIILESATFSLYHLRKTQMKHGIFSEAITRFTKGQPAPQTLPVLEATIKYLGETPLEISDCYPAKPSTPEISLSLADINSLLGTSYDAKTVTTTLENVGFSVVTPEGWRVEGPRRPASEASGVERGHDVPGPRLMRVVPPSWRTDIHIKEDVIEEVGRMNGFDNIPLDFPTRPFIGAKEDPLLKLKNRVRDILSDRLNAHEVLTYSFVSKKLQNTVGENSDDSYKIVNSISPELQRFRQTLTPSLLEKVSMNLKSGHHDFSLYEINQITKKSLGLNSENVPEMKTNLAFATIGDFYLVKAYFLALLKELGITTPDLEELTGNDYPYLEPRHSANTGFCSFGEVRSSVLKSLKISEKVSVFELDLEKLLEILPKSAEKSLKFSKFPSVSRDITIKVKPEVAFKPVQDTLKRALAESDLKYAVLPASIYQADDRAKNLSFKLEFASFDHTLSSDEISGIMEKVNNSVIREFKAEIV